MDNVIALPSFMSAGANYWWLGVCAALAVLATVVGRQALVGAAFSDTRARVLMIPFVNVLTLCVIARYFAK